jgi:hypothetical protein
MHLHWSASVNSNYFEINNEHLQGDGEDYKYGFWLQKSVNLIGHDVGIILRVWEKGKEETSMYQQLLQIITNGLHQNSGMGI